MTSNRRHFARTIPIAALSHAQLVRARIDALDGRDLKRWHREWSAPTEPGGEPRLAAARMSFAVIKAALSFGISCRLPGCAELKLILKQQRFAGPRPRTVAPTAADIEAVRKTAHDQDHASAAFAYALQFEGGMRQWDVIGKWVPLRYMRAGRLAPRPLTWPSSSAIPTSRTTAEIYDRDELEAHRRVARARLAYHNETEEKT